VGVQDILDGVGAQVGVPDDASDQSTGSAATTNSVSPTGRSASSPSSRFIPRGTRHTLVCSTRCPAVNVCFEVFEHVRIARVVHRWWWDRRITRSSGRARHSTGDGCSGVVGRVANAMVGSTLTVDIERILRVLKPRRCCIPDLTSRSGAPGVLRRKRSLDELRLRRSAGDSITYAGGTRTVTRSTIGGRPASLVTSSTRTGRRIGRPLREEQQ